MRAMTEQKKRWAWGLGLFAILFAISAATCWNVLQDPEQVLAFNDGNIEGMLSSVCQFPTAFLRVWSNQSFLGSAGKQCGIATWSLLESIGPVFTRRTGQPFLLAFCGLAIFWSLRQFRVGRPAAALTAAILVNTGWSTTFAFTGLSVRPVALACALLAVGFAEQGRISSRWLPYAIGGACLGLGISEVPDVGAILAVGAAFIFFWTHFWGQEFRIQNPESSIETPTSERGHKDECSTALRADVLGGKGPLSRGSRLRPVVRSPWSILPRFALFVACSVILAWQMLSIMFATNIQGVTQGSEETPAARYAWATQWSIPPAELWNTVSGSYFGTTMRSETAPYWGRTGRSEGWEKTKQGFRNFSLTGWHLGVIPCILLLALPVWLFRTRHSRNQDSDSCPFPPRSFAWMVCSGCVLALMLVLGKYFFAYRLLWMLPFFDTIRNPDKWNGVFLLCGGLGIAFMLNALWSALAAVAPEGTAARAPAKTTAKQATNMTSRLAPWQALCWAALGIAVLGLLVTFWTQANKAGFVAARASEGYGGTAELMWNNALSASMKVFLLAALFGGMACWITRRLRNGKSVNAWFLLGVTAVLALGDLMVVNRAYSMPHKYRHYLSPNPLSDYLDAHKTEGRVKLLPPQNPLLNNLRLSLLQVKDYDLFDPVSVSRMPADEEALFKALNANLPRLWEFGTVRYFLTLPGAMQQLNQMDGNRGRFVERLSMGVGVVNDSYLPIAYAPTDQQYLRLVEFTGALPFYHVASTITRLPETVAGGQEALRLLAQPDFDPARDAIVLSSETIELPNATNTTPITILRHDPAEATVRVAMDQAGLLVRSVKFDPDWKATVDDKPATIYRANYLFQGVVIPPGQHTVTFVYAPPQTAMAIALVGRGLLLLMVLALILSKRQRQEA